MCQHDGLGAPQRGLDAIVSHARVPDAGAPSVRLNHCGAIQRGVDHDPPVRKPNLEDRKDYRDGIRAGVRDDHVQPQRSLGNHEIAQIPRTRAGQGLSLSPNGREERGRIGVVLSNRARGMRQHYHGDKDGRQSL